MSVLRRRIFGRSAAEDSDDSREPSPAPLPDHHRRGSEQVSVSARKLQQLNEHVKKTKGSKRRTAWIFGLGGLAGVVAAMFFATNSEMIDLAYLKDMHFESLMDVLPAGIVRDAHELQKSERDAIAYDSFSVGLNAKAQGIEASHPVIMIPGVISTGLENWSTEDDAARQYFRKRLWGSWSMMRALVLDKASWKRHIMLDKDTGLDPPGVKLRAAQGFDAADFFITGYWIWNKILENLATIGYDATSAFTAAYDWRLSYSNLEVRDQYFTRLKAYIEMSSKIRGKKVVLLSHSMGSQVLYYFFQWVEAEGKGCGNGGTSWVDDHVESWINISGCMLGAVKGIPAVLSGEMKDTAQLNAFAVYGLEKFLSRAERAEIFRAMPGISSMLPIGGDAVWGNSTWAPDDPPERNTSYGRFITFHKDLSEHAKNMTVGDSIPYLLERSDPWYAKLLKTNYSHGVAHTREEVEANQKDPLKWINPLETRLPHAPNMKIYCFYGIGKDTERSYKYREDTDPTVRLNVSIDTSNCNDGADRGIIMGEGDGTVNLLSTGYMCARGWHIPRYNPSGVKITTVEMEHDPDRFNPRGGPKTGDHVDILGRASLNELILKVAGGKGDEIEDYYVSNIREYSKRVKISDTELESL